MSTITSTRAYASPEQMRDTNYDASTDVYSLGLMLFELCYPMYTSMERYTEFGNIRKGRFPAYWMSDVKPSFPTMHDILVQMLSDSPSKRPTASVVSDQVDSILREYSIQSLDKSWEKKGALLLRVEAQEKEGVLQDTMKIIKDAIPQCTILQYGLRGQASKAIMEFALDISDNEKSTAVKTITSQLEQHDMNIRRILS
jgi:serine/threonine protein kinase